MKTPEEIFDEAIKTKGLDIVSVKDADLYEAGLSAIQQALSLGSVSIRCFWEVINILPHSKSRVPYTYHHDYLRQNSKVHSGMSRSDVASSHTADGVELYAIALTQLLDELGSKAIYHINSNDVLICKKAKEITDAAVSRYNCR